MLFSSDALSYTRHRLFFAVQQILQSFLAAIAFVVPDDDVFTIGGNDVVLCIFRVLLRVIAAVLKTVAFNSDIARRDYKNTAPREIDKKVVVYEKLLMHAGGVFQRIGVMAGVEDNRALACDAVDMRTIFNDIIPDFNGSARPRLPPDANIRSKEQRGQRHSIKVAVLDQDVMRLDEKAARTRAAYGAAVDMQRRKVLRVGKDVAGCEGAGFFAEDRVVFLVDCVDHKRALSEKRLRIININGVAGDRPFFRKRMGAVGTRAKHGEGSFF